MALFLLFASRIALINSALPTPAAATPPAARATPVRGTVLTAAPASVVTRPGVAPPRFRAMVVPAARPGTRGGKIGEAEAVARQTARVKEYKPWIKAEL